MEPQPIYYDPSQYYETQTGNKLCKKNLIRGSDNIFIIGKVIMQQKNTIRGDLGRINLGKFIILCEGVTLRPSYVVLNDEQKTKELAELGWIPFILLFCSYFILFIFIIAMNLFGILHTFYDFKTTFRQVKYTHITLGDYVIVEANSIVQASKIGSNVIIGKNCIIGHRSVISDNVKILDDSLVLPDTVIPPYCIFGGKPARYIAELPETASHIHKDMAMQYYKWFTPKKANP